MKYKTKYKVKTHGLSGSRFYIIWGGMKERCLNPNQPNWKSYGGKGITVCDEWKDFNNFYRDMFPSYSEGLSIDRIDNYKGYSKENCRWVTVEYNNRRHRNTIYYEVKGIKYTASEMAEIAGISLTAMQSRLKRHGFTPEEAISLPKGTWHEKLRNKLD